MIALYIPDRSEVYIRCLCFLCLFCYDVPTEQYSKRRRTALWCTVSLLMLSVVVLAIGLLAATRTGNVAVAGYYPGIIVSKIIVQASAKDVNLSQSLSMQLHQFNGQECFVFAFVKCDNFLAKVSVQSLAVCEFDQGFRYTAGLMKGNGCRTYVERMYVQIYYSVFNLNTYYSTNQTGISMKLSIGTMK